MPVELIPNQPIIFEDPIGNYPCLNNDNRAYGILMQDGDEICIQWKLAECTPGVMCEPNMVMDPVGTDELGSWTVTGGWTTSGSDRLSFDGTGNPGGDATQNLTLTSGAVYRLTFNITGFTGDETLTIEIDGQFFTVTEAGTYTFYFISITGGTDITWYIDGTTSITDQITIEDIETVQFTDCWLDDQYLGVSSWSYDFNGADGKFCSTVFEGGDLINTNAFTTTGNYHGVNLTISEATQGGLQVILGGVTLGTTSGNGQFNYYGTPTSGTDLVFSKTNDFDGCVSLVNVTDYGDVGSYSVTFHDDDSTNFTNGPEAPTVFEDRLVFCSTLEVLDWEYGVPDCATLKVDLYDPCLAVTYESVNRINYNNAGHECTKMVEAWNDGYAFGFYFGDVNAPDFKLKQRLRVLAFNPVYRNQAEEYLYSSGNSGRSFAQSQKARTAWFDYCDEYCHDTIRTQLLSNKLTIDGYAFFYPAEDYEPEWNERGKYNLAQSRVTVVHEETIFGSTCGTLANAICPPVYVPNVTKVSMKATLDSVALGFDFTSVNYADFQYDELGNVSVGSGGAGDLTDNIDIGTFMTLTLKPIFDAFYSVNSSWSANYTSNTFTLLISAPINLQLPQPELVITLIDGSGNAIPIATTFE